jgi:hypothetical protein
MPQALAEVSVHLVRLLPNIVQPWELPLPVISHAMAVLSVAPSKLERALEDLFLS